MVMQTIQVRIEKGLIKRMDSLVENGLYANKAEIMRDAVRRLFVETLVGITPNVQDSVKQIRSLRKNMKKHSLKEINTV